MDQFMRDNFFQEKSKVMVNIAGKIFRYLEETGKIIKYKVLVNIFGEMEESTLVTGRTANCTVMVYMYGLTEENMMENISTIKNKDSERTRGQMEEVMKVNGKMVNNMEMASLLILKVISDQAYG